MEITTLKVLLSDPWKFSAKSALFLSFQEKWTLETKAAVVDDDEVDENDKHTEANRLGYEYAIGVAQTNSVISNLLAQVNDPSDSQRLEALLF